MKDSIIVLVLVFVVAFGGWFLISSEYLVEIKYCDNRPPKTKITREIWPPNNRDIANNKKGAPQFAGEINVCEVKTLKKLD